MSRIKDLLIILTLLGIVNGQIPAFGGCPQYDPLPNFNKEKFLGTWYEVERLFTVTELASKCVAVNYVKQPDGKIWLDNFITNRFTGVQRKISGVMKLTGRGNEATYNVRYNSLPLNYDTTLNILDTDYKTFAVIYSCNGIGPLGHTQSVWLFAREREPAGPIMQRAYGVLDKFKIARTFFIKTDQSNCEIVSPPQEAYDPAVSSQRKKSEEEDEEIEVDEN